MDPTAKARFDLISGNLAEVINPELLEEILAQGRNPRVYWGTATTGVSALSKGPGGDGCSRQPVQYMGCHAMGKDAH